MKSKILPILLLLLVLLNGFLIFMLVNKPHEKIKNNPEKTFLTKQLEFSKVQKERFSVLDEKHKKKMMHLERQVRENRDILFSSFDKNNFDSSEILEDLGIITAKKDAEIFDFFSKVRALCTTTQAKKFDKIINKALKRGNKRPPPLHGNDNHPPRRDGDMPPPPR